MKKTLLFNLFLFMIILNPLWAQQIGIASFYSRHIHGHRTSDGSRYHRDSLTCAHKTYPFGTLLRVRNPENSKEVIVKVTDRGPHRRNRLIDLSWAAAKQLDIIRKGIAKVEIWEINSLPEPLLLLPVPLSTIKSASPIIQDIRSIVQLQGYIFHLAK